MALWRKEQGSEAAVIVVSLAGREDLLPDFSHALGRETRTIGRHDSCSIQIVDGLVSRQHMRIRYDPDTGQYYASDLNSANGTQVNGRLLLNEVRLSEGDVIEVGTSRLIFTRRRFKDHQSALAHFRKPGEHVRATLLKPPD